jgi:hypothetical protein
MTDTLDVTVILTCFDREAYVPYALRVIESYRRLRPQVVLCYNGTNDLSCDVHLPPDRKHVGDHAMTLAGYRLRRHDRILKLSIDSWLLDEEPIVRIFDRLESQQLPYAGNHWHGNVPGSLATDIIFADLRFGDPFANWTELGPTNMEAGLWTQLRSLGKRHLTILEREPVHQTNRFACSKLRWAMDHDLEKNLELARKWAPWLGF